MLFIGQQDLHYAAEPYGVLSRDYDFPEIHTCITNELVLSLNPLQIAFGLQLQGPIINCPLAWEWGFWLLLLDNVPQVFIEHLPTFTGSGTAY